MDVCTKLVPHSKICIRCLTVHDLAQFEQDMKQNQATGEEIALICYDINALRKINHAYGRATGDAVLSAVACYMAQTMRGTIYRIEGDLFCVVIRNCKPDHAIRLIRKIEKRFDLPWEIEVNNRKSVLFVNIMLSIIDITPDTFGEFYPDFFEHALEYSRKMKAATIFDHNTKRILQEQVRMQMDLKNSILRGMVGFDIFFQPIADPISGTWKGLETLCRWSHPDHGKVSPYTFIKEAEKMGFIHNIGTWVLEKAVQTCKRLSLDMLDNFFVSVNVSALQIIRHDFAEIVLGILQRYDYPCEKLLLEITESSEFIINSETQATIDSLRDNGVMFALDDFGTGYSSFNSLKHMPIDYLKTERDFILNIEQDSYLQYFFYVMSEVAHNSGMKLIAEGVETKEQLDCVIRNGADLIQGYYFGKPLCTADLEANLHCFKQPSASIRCEPQNYLDYPKWIHSKKAYTITPALFNLFSRCMDILLNAETPDDSVDTILGTVGQHFKVKRAYIFLNDHGTLFSNRYEWCAEDAPSQMQLLQSVDAASDDFYDILMKNKIFMTTTQSHLPENLRQRLREAGQEDSVQSLVVMPLSKKDEVIGFVGFDDDRPREWTPEEIILLHNLCMLVLIVLSSINSANSHGQVPPSSAAKQ